MSDKKKADTPRKKKRPSPGERLRAARKALELTQAEVAELACLPRGQTEVGQVERGKNAKAIMVAARIADVVGVPVEDLTG